jgi:hypothetical protein
MDIFTTCRTLRNQCQARLVDWCISKQGWRILTVQTFGMCRPRDPFTRPLFLVGSWPQLHMAAPVSALEIEQTIDEDDAWPKIYPI